jgi:DedD protein
MRDGNVRVREKFELSLDGRQIASIVVGALVILAVVFVLGLNVGRQTAARQAVAPPGGDLAALDQVPAPDAQAKITFYDQLPKNRPPAPPPLQKAPPATPVAAPAAAEAAASSPPATSAAAAVAAAAPAGGPTVTASVAEPADAPAAPSAPSARPPPPGRAPSPASRSGASGGSFTVQLAATATRGDAERLAAKYASLGARVEPADVPGKGRLYRVRAGRFPDRASAERYLKDAVRETGAKGFVTESR